MFQFELHPHTDEICTVIGVYDKRWGNKICRSPSDKQSWASWFVKKRTSWRCGIGLNILLPTAVPVVCLSYCRLHGSECQTTSNKKSWLSGFVKKWTSLWCVIQHRHTFGLLSHHGRLGARGLRRKSPLDDATDLLWKMWQHITTVSFVSAFIVVFSRKPKNQCVTNICILIRIRQYQSEYSYSYSYSPFFVTPNIFVFVFALFYEPEYIRIRIPLRHGYRIY